MYKFAGQHSAQTLVTLFQQRSFHLRVEELNVSKCSPQVFCLPQDPFSSRRWNQHKSLSLISPGSHKRSTGILYQVSIQLLMCYLTHQGPEHVSINAPLTGTHLDVSAQFVNPVSLMPGFASFNTILSGGTGSYLQQPAPRHELAVFQIWPVAITSVGAVIHAHTEP